MFPAIFPGLPRSFPREPPNRPRKQPRPSRVFWRINVVKFSVTRFKPFFLGKSDRNSATANPPHLSLPKIRTSLTKTFGTAFTDEFESPQTHPDLQKKCSGNFFCGIDRTHAKGVRTLEKSDNVKRHLSRRHLSVLNLLFNFILDGGYTCEQEIRFH